MARHIRALPFSYATPVQIEQALKSVEGRDDCVRATIDFNAALYRDKLEKIRPGYFEELVGITKDVGIALNNSRALKDNSDPKNYPEDTLTYLCEMAVSGKLKREDYAKAVKYLTEICKRIELFPGSSGREYAEYDGRTSPSIKQYPTLADLFIGIKDNVPLNKMPVSNVRDTMIESGDIHVVYDTPDLKIYTPLTEAASQALGVGTQWCIAQTEGCMFDRYNKSGRFLILFPKNETPVALQFPEREFRDSDDKMINIHDLIRKYPVVARIASWHLDEKDRGPLADFLLSPNVSESMVYYAGKADRKAVAKVFEGTLPGWDADEFLTQARRNVKSSGKAAPLATQLHDVGRDYLNIREHPDAAPEVQALALKIAKEKLSQIETLMPHAHRASLENVRKAFSVLKHPTDDMTNWLKATDLAKQVGNSAARG